MCFCKVKKTVFAAKFYDSIDFYNETFPLYTVHTVLCTVSNLSDAFCPRGIAIELSEWLPVTITSGRIQIIILPYSL